MFSIEIPNLFAVSAPDEKALERLIARALALREEHAESIKAAPAPVSYAPASAGCATPNLAKWEALHPGKRLRMSNEESLTYGKGETAREETAKARLLAMGETLASGEANATGAGGAEWEGEIAPEVADFEA